MPRISRRVPRHRTTYGRGHLLHLLTGHDFFGGFGRDTKDALPAMREAWADAGVRAAVYDLMTERQAACVPLTTKHETDCNCPACRTTPWAATQFGGNKR